MKQSRCVLPTYSADSFGVCSALFELGGLIVMHDASGCNSTYTTHDEPRWYRSDSLVFISALTETDAILGNDEKLLRDMEQTIQEFHPSFAVIVGTPIPMMTGFDYAAAAAALEARTGIPCFGFAASGMRSYLCGAAEALEAFARRMTAADAKKRARSVNILGATPLDFSLGGTPESVKALLAESGWNVVSCWAMGSTLKDIARAGEAEVNLVISGTGMKAALALKERFGTPFVAGLPTGNAFAKRVLETLKRTAKDGIDRFAFTDFAPTDDHCLILGEGVIARSLAASVGMECGCVPKVVHTLETLPELRCVLSEGDAAAGEEEALQALCSNAETVIADPLYKPILPQTCRLISLPHEAFSGRIYRVSAPDMVRIRNLQFAIRN